MSGELVPYQGPRSGLLDVSKNRLPLPRSPEELYGYFAAREDERPTAYKGYAELAALAADAMDEARRFGMTEDVKENDIALVPGYAEGMYTSEHTDASRELLELIIISHHLEPVADEVTEARPYGRILWQSSQGGAGLNLIEHRFGDKKGDIVKITAVSHVPEDLWVNSRFIKEVSAGIDSIPVIEIDEAALVEDYFRKAA